MNEGSSLGMPSSDEPNLYHPDQIIRPNAPTESGMQPSTQMTPEPEPQTAAVVMPDPGSSPMAQPTPSSDPPSVTASSSEPAPSSPAPAAEQHFTPVPDTPPAEEVAPMSQAPITWTASEYVANQKSSSWYALLAVAAVGIAAVVWLLTRDLFPTIAVLIGIVLLGVYAGRQPREETYALDDHGLTIGNRHMAYQEFRSFAVAQEGAFLSIELAPLKRFAVDTTLYVDPKDEDQIIERLSQHLPMEEAKSSFTDGLMRRIKF